MVGFDNRKPYGIHVQANGNLVGEFASMSGEAAILALSWWASGRSEC
jgi:hypothetical protein